MRLGHGSCDEVKRAKSTGPIANQTLDSIKKNPTTPATATTAAATTKVTTTAVTTAGAVATTQR